MFCKSIYRVYNFLYMKWIDNYKGYYIYPDGRVWSISTNKFIKSISSNDKIKYRLYRKAKDYDEILMTDLIKIYYR